uniref:Uncharacterized protein n=1 Tax=Rhodnius prolixus TaxID=13249 RepID=T1HA45_RHOPR
MGAMPSERIIEAEPFAGTGVSARSCMISRAQSRESSLIWDYIVVFIYFATTAMQCQVRLFTFTYCAAIHRVVSRIVFQEQVVASWKFLWCTSREVKYPLRGQDQLEITYIEIIDNYSNGYGGCPYIVEGGVGNNFVKIYIKSQFNRGFDFEINIYGVQPQKKGEKLI